MIIIGHRGAAGLDFENTISSLKTAQDWGVDMVEVDLRQSKSGKIIATHGRPGKKQFAISLTEALGVIRTAVNFEIKEPGFERVVLESVKNFSSGVLFSSKYPWILKKIRTLDENVRLGLVLGRANFFLLPFLPLLDRFLNLYSVHPKTFLSQILIIRFLKNLDKKVFVWTINDPIRFEKLKTLGVDGVFTDRPDLIRK